MLNLGKSSILLGVEILLCLLAVQVKAAEVCTFHAPDGWNQSTTRWDGECRADYADGLGILKEYDKNQVARFFFGRIRKGELDLGVIEEAGGYIAGQFAQGRVLASEDPQRFVSAFAVAEKAATLAAGRFRKAGNKTSATFYEAKAKQLREQMD